MPYENQHSNNSDQGAEDSFQLLGFLQRRKGFIILLAALGMVLAYIHFNRQLPTYSSSALVQVIHRNPDPRIGSLIAENDITDSDFVVRSHKTLLDAFTSHQLGELAVFRGMTAESAVGSLNSMINTKPVSANVLQILATGSNPVETQRIAQAVAEQYVLAQRENYQDATEVMKGILSKARDEFLQKLQEEEAEYAKFREQCNLSPEGSNPYSKSALAAHAKHSELTLLETELRSKLTQIESALSSGGSREAVLLLITKQEPDNKSDHAIATEQRTEAKSLATVLLPLYVEEASLMETVGSDHPKLKAIRTRIEMTRKNYQHLAGDVKPNEMDFLDLYLVSLKEELRVIQKQQEAVLRLATEADRQAKELMQEEIEDSNRKREIERLSKLFDETTLQISQVQVHSGMGGVSAQVLSPAEHGTLVYPILIRFLSFGAFLGALAGVLLGYVVDLADRSFRKPDDVIREFGLPILGHIPYITEQRLKSVTANGGVDRTAVSVHLPRSRPAEAFRSVRTAVCFSAVGGAHRLLQVTSPAAGDGKSTLSLNLAISLAQSGKKTVLVECDFRRPKVHKLTGVSCDVGFVNVLRGENSLEEVVQSTFIDNFFVISCGKRPGNPAELLAGECFAQQLERLRGLFDYVILDTPPVLAVTDPCTVAAQVDGTLICMRLSRHTRDLGRRSVEQLRDVGATITGVVINGVEERDAYGYGNYRYSDYRYYYKNYDYKYGYGKYSDGREYYADEHVAEPAFSVGESDEPGKD